MNRAPLIIRRKVRLHVSPRTRRMEPSLETRSGGRFPRVARLMAQALHFEQLLQQGQARDYVELAHLGKVSPARLTQIMNLRLLAPDIQEAILFLPPTRARRHPITERHLRPIVAQIDWQRQRLLWDELRRRRDQPARGD